MKLSDYVIDFLVRQGIGHIFEVCGGAIAHLLDATYDRTDITAVSMHHEQAASFAAEGYSRLKGRAGVAMATSGPGATNLITGIASCFFDSVPCLFITGQVNTYEFKNDRPSRQIGFQETDIVRLIKPVVKDAVLVKDPQMIRYQLERTLFLAHSGRPGPVLLDIPMDIQRADIDPVSLRSFSGRKGGPSLNEGPKVSQGVIRKIARWLHSSRRPVILAGGGIRASRAHKEFLHFAKKTRIPVVTSLMGLDAISHDNPSFVGMIGTYGNRYANLALANADLVLALGTRLDTRQTGTNPKTFSRNAKIVHVDIDPAELNNKVRADLAVLADLKMFLPALESKVKRYDRKIRAYWEQTIKSYARKYPSFHMSKEDAVDPNFLFRRLSRYLAANAVICADVGQNQMWAAQSLILKGSQRFLTEGGMGAMGSALGLAIGASFADRKRPVIVITGDGGFQLNIQELQTLAHHGLWIKIILLNNSCYGMVRQFQEQYFKARFQSTTIGYSCPDFQNVVSAFKVRSRKISKVREINKAFTDLFKDKGPSFLEVSIPRKTQVLPKLSVNRPIEDQDPPLPREELKKLLFQQ